MLKTYSSERGGSQIEDMAKKSDDLCAGSSLSFYSELCRRGIGQGLLPEIAISQCLTLLPFCCEWRSFKVIATNPEKEIFSWRLYLDLYCCDRFSCSAAARRIAIKAPFGPLVLRYLLYCHNTTFFHVSPSLFLLSLQYK